MRYKFLVIIAIFVMILGVMGIVTQGKETKSEDKASASEPVKKREIYFMATRDVAKGEVVTPDDFRERVIEYKVGAEPVWLKDSIKKDDINKIKNEGLVMAKSILKEQVLKTEDVESIVDKIKSDFIIMPISVLASSMSNPSLYDRGFIDLYLISNDNQTFRSEYFQGRDQLGKEYKDTRVKIFAENVYYFRNFKDAKEIENKTENSWLKKSSESNAAQGKLSGDNDNIMTVYAFFLKKDVEYVIQAQILGMFFVSPKNVTNLDSGLSKIFRASREVTPADIVSGAPSSGNHERVIEIRGASK